MRTLIASKIRLAVLAALTILVAQPALKAQTPGSRAVANIPFAFQIASYHYPAGTYTLGFLDGQIVSIHGAHSSGVMMVMSSASRHAADTSQLVFHHYGNHYFLREIRIARDGQVMTSPFSSEEHRAQKEEEALNQMTLPANAAGVEVALAPAVR